MRVCVCVCLKFNFAGFSGAQKLGQAFVYGGKCAWGAIRSWRYKSRSLPFCEITTISSTFGQIFEPPSCESIPLSTFLKFIGANEIQLPKGFLYLLASLYSSCVHPLSWFLGIGHRS